MSIIKTDGFIEQTVKAIFNNAWAWYNYPIPITTLVGFNEGTQTPDSSTSLSKTGYVVTVRQFDLIQSRFEAGYWASNNYIGYIFIRGY